MIEELANWVTIIVSPLAILSIWGLLYQMRRDGLAASASAVYSSFDSINGVIKTLPMPGEAGRSEGLRDLFNQLELACALWFDGQLVGRTGKLAFGLLKDLILMVERDDDLRGELQLAIHDTSTFKNIADFKRLLRGREKL